MSLNKIKYSSMSLLFIFATIFYTNHSTYAQEQEPGKEIAVEPVKKVSIGIFVWGNISTKAYQEGLKNFEDFFSKNGLPADIFLIRALEPASVEATKNLDFYFTRTNNILIENLADSDYSPIAKKSDCTKQSHLFVSSKSKIKTLDDLKDKKIIYGDLDTPRNPTLNFLASLGLTKSKIYYSNNAELAFSSVKKGFADAVLFDEYTEVNALKGKLKTNLPVSQSEILSDFKELSVSPPSSCVVVIHSKKIDKEIVGKFSKILQAYNQQDPSLVNFKYTTTPATIEEFTKETTSYPWTELKALRSKIGQMKEATAPAKK